VNCARPHLRTIHVRIRAGTSGAEVKINERSLGRLRYQAPILRSEVVWQDGDTLTVRLPMELRQESLARRRIGNGSPVRTAGVGSQAWRSPADGPGKIIHGEATVPQNLPPAGSCRR